MKLKSRVLWLTSLLLFVLDSKVVSEGLALCPETQLRHRVSTKNMEPLLVRLPDSEKSVSFRVWAGNCSEGELFHINTPDAFLGEDDLKWFQIASGVKFGRLYVVVNDVHCYAGEKDFTTDCNSNAFSFAFNSRVKVAKFCNRPPRSNNLLNMCEEDANEELWREIQNLSDEKQIEGIKVSDAPSWRSHHLYPVGVIIVFISVCLKCWLYSRWKSGRRNRTVVTVIRRVPVRSQDLIQGMESMSADPTNLPPSYVDIENECPPPPYSSVLGLKTQSDNSLDGDISSAPSSEPSAFDGSSTGFDNGLAKKDTRSTVSRMLRAAPKSIKSQFSFKPMKEEE